MGPKNPGESIESGLNTQVDYGSRRYDVQTQCSAREAPVIESIVFHDGQALVRITASYGDVAERFGFSAADGQHLLELQHADLIRKIHHGMLRGDDETPADAGRARVAPTDAADVELSNVEEPEVRELLKQLGAAIEQSKFRKAQGRNKGQRTTPPRSWFRRIVVRFRI